jgi:hypothetical protein
MVFYVVRKESNRNKDWVALCDRMGAKPTDYLTAEYKDDTKHTIHLTFKGKMFGDQTGNFGIDFFDVADELKSLMIETKNRLEVGVN